MGDSACGVRHTRRPVRAVSLWLSDSGAVFFQFLEFLSLVERMPGRFKVSLAGGRKWLYRKAVRSELPPSLGPSLVGWTLIEIASRSLFALDRPWPPVIAALIPALFNVTLTLWLRSHQPQWIGLGASLGLLAGFATLFLVMRANRQRWLAQG